MNISVRDKFIQQVIETALYFRDMHEEKNNGDTRVIKLIKPINSIQNKAVRDFVLNDLYQKQNLSLSDVVLKFAIWHPEGAELPPFEIEDIRAELLARCLEHERPMQLNIDSKTLIRRSFLRAAGYIRRISENDAPVHSRVVEIFIPEVFVPHGSGSEGPGHREHVVPCIYLLKESLKRYKEGAGEEEIADFLQRHVAIVEITAKQQKYLDGSKREGNLGLKDKMPVGWRPDHDCIFQRLHEAKIKFTPPAGFNSCETHGCRGQA